MSITEVKGIFKNYLAERNLGLMERNCTTRW